MRTVLSVLSGLVAGAAGVAFLSPETLHQSTSATPEVTDLGSGPIPAAPRVDQGRLVHSLTENGALQRTTAYQLAVQSDAHELRAIIEELAVDPASGTHRFALSVLFARYAELDTAGSIDALSRLQASQLAEAMALEILDVIGIDDFNIAWVAGSLQNSDTMRFRVEAIAKLAESAPSAALQLVLLTDSRAHRAHAIRRVARAWAHTDPAAAVAAGKQLQDRTLRNTMLSVAGQEWARAEPGTLLSHLAGISDRAQFIALARTGAIRELADSYPERLLAIADELPDTFANDVKAAALYNWSETDPLAAWTYAETMPPGQRRQQAQQQIARIYGRTDPDAALSWLETVEGSSADLTNQVLQGIAEEDPERALTVAFSSDLKMRQPWATQMIMMRIGTTDPGRMPQVADAVLGLDAGRRDEAIAMFAQAWARIDGEAALEWALSRTDMLQENTLSQIAAQLAQEDPRKAIRYVGRVPPEARDGWIRSVAGAYARYDHQGATDWVSQYRGQDAYVPAMLAVVGAATEQDPVAAANLLDSLGTLPVQSRDAVVRIVRTWAAQDNPAARRYALRLPQGEIRDAALTSLIAADRGTALPDTELSAAFSSDLAREQAIAQIISNVARNDAAEARRLIAEHISSPAIRRQAEQSVERIRR